MEKTQSLYERLGGIDAVNAAVDIFYKKVLADPSISHFFTETNIMEQSGKQKAFLAYAFGGPVKYHGKGMRDAHAHLVRKGLDHQHFDAVAGHLAATLRELGVSEDLVAEVTAVAESTRTDVLGKEQPRKKKFIFW